MLKKSMIVLFTLVFTVSVQMVFSPVTAIATCSSEKCGAVPYSDRKFGEFSREMREYPNDPMRDGIPPQYGNWCGMGHGGAHGDPINTLDSLCKEHDLCYDNGEIGNCECDKQLISGIDANFDEMGVMEKLAAKAIKGIFETKLALCSVFS